MKGLLLLSEMLDNADSQCVLTNSIMGHLKAYSSIPSLSLPLSLTLVPSFFCVQPLKLLDSFDVNVQCFISDEQSRVPSD